MLREEKMERPNFIEDRKRLFSNVRRDNQVLETIVRTSMHNIGVLPFVRTDGEMQQYVVDPKKVFGFKVIERSIEQDIERGEGLIFDREIQDILSVKT